MPTKDSASAAAGTIDPGFWLRLLPSILSAYKSNNTGQQALGAAGLANQVASHAGVNIPYAGPALGAAGAGFGIANVANSDLSTKRKAGVSANIGARAIAGAVNPYAGAAMAIEALGNRLQQSNSPEWRGGGRVLSNAAVPSGAQAINALNSGGSLNDVFRGQPGGAGGALMLDLLGPVGLALRGIGGDVPRKAVNMMSFGALGHKPTEGTSFRDVLGQVMNRLGGFDGERTGAGLPPPPKNREYNLDVNTFNNLDPNVRDAATVLGHFMASRTPQYKNNPGYGGQAQNILLNRYGADVLPLALQTFQRYNLAPQDVLRGTNDPTLASALERLTGGRGGVQDIGARPNFGRPNPRPGQPTAPRPNQPFTPVRPLSPNNRPLR